MFTSQLQNKYLNIFANLVILIVYTACGKLGLMLAFDNPSATAVWAPTGIAVASMLIFGYKVWPAIFFGAFLVNTTTAGSLFTSFFIAIGNTLEGLAGVYLMRRFSQGKNTFYRVQNVLKFTIIALVVTPISATIGVTTLLFGGLTDFDNYLSVWLTWWLGDASGLLIVAPFIITWFSKFKFDLFDKKKVLELITWFSCLYLVEEIVFQGIFPHPYILIPIFVWIVFRFGQRGGITSILIVAFLAIFHTLNSSGPFAINAPTLNAALLSLQTFLGVSTISILVLASAILESQDAELIIKYNEKRLTHLLEKSADAFALLDEIGTITYASPSTERLLGYTQIENLGKNAFEFIHPDDVVSTRQAFFQLIQMKPGESITAEYRFRRKDGQWRWMVGVGTNLLDDPSIKAIVVNYHDITKRKTAEEKIQQENAENEALLDSIGEGLVATDKDGKITYINRAFEELLGWREEEVVGQLVKDIVIIQDDKGKMVTDEKRPLFLSLRDKKKVTNTYNIMRKDKVLFPAVIVASPVVLNDQVIGAIKVFRDITQEKEIDQAKTEFVSIASHQLRTPLGISKWYLEAIKSEDYFKTLPVKGREYINTVYESNERLLYIVRNLLNIARIDQGKGREEPAEVDIIETIKEVIKRNQVNISKKSITMDIRETLLPKLYLDKKKFADVLENLISNSIKYTKEHGKVVISFKVKDQLKSDKESEQKYVEIIITDNGIGIADKDKTKIFSKFFRADNAMRSESTGSGLGLYLVKSYLYEWKGLVWFESQEGKGSTFHIQLPLNS
jgi:PAS domain S-box-containing protein